MSNFHLQEIETLQNSLREREEYITELENRLRALWDKYDGDSKHYMDRIKRLEEQLMDTKNKHAVLVADVVLNEDRAERIKRLETLGHELRECASRIGTVASGEGSVIRRTEEAIQAWDKEANQ